MARFIMNLLIATTTTMTTAAFMVPSVERPPGTTFQKRDLSLLDENPPAAWRVALNLGRESSTPLWDSYGRSGARFPVVVPCEFTDNGLVVPRSDTVSYTAIHGGVTKPVQGGRWKLSHNKEEAHRNLQFTLSFPEELVKHDVKIPSGSTLVMEGFVYSLQDLKALDQAFADARKQEWKAQESLDDIYRLRDGPKKWNPDTQKWERPVVDEPVMSLISKQLDLFTKRQERQRRFAAKPRAVDMSAQAGRFPGFDDNDESNNDRIYMGAHGVIRLQQQNSNDAGRGMVIGRWSAEPIN